VLITTYIVKHCTGSFDHAADILQFKERVAKLFSYILGEKINLLRSSTRGKSQRWARIRSTATFFGSGFEFSGKTGSGMYGMVYIECKVHVCK